MLWGSYGATLVSLLVFLYLCWLDGFCPHKSTESATPVGGGNTGDFESGPCADQVVTNSRWIRMAVFLISVALIAACAVITLVSFILLYFISTFLCRSIDVHLYNALDTFTNSDTNLSPMHIIYPAKE